MKYPIAKGLFDILPYPLEEKWKHTDAWHFIESVIHKLCQDYGFLEIRTPVFEKTELFNRAVGEASDIVSKEMYTFLDKKGRSLSLRPEGTASVMRAFVEKNLQMHKKIHRLYYIAPMFRYERPQSGRYRQHHQFGVELIGAKGPYEDAEIIDMCLEYYRRLGLNDLTLLINSVGDATSRENYKKALKEYLFPFKEELSEDSKIRLEKNPLRILDSKDTKDQNILKNAPSISDYLSIEAKEDFQTLLELLDELNIFYKVEEKLVRGLDYYNKTVFEITSGSLGAQNAIGAGGRYDGLTKAFGGKDEPGIGFASGIERTLQTLLAQNIEIPIEQVSSVYFIPLEPDAKKVCLKLATFLRHKKIEAVIDFEMGKLKNALQKANKQNASYAVILGSNELKKQIVTCKDLEKQTQIEIPINDFVTTLTDF